MRVRLFMLVQIGHNRWMGGHSEGWRRTVDMPVCPQRGERIELWPEGPMVEVKERWFSHQGQPYCELRTCVIDPDDDEQRYHSHDPLPTTWIWWTADQRTRLRQGLLDGGWTAETDREGVALDSDRTGPPETP